MRGLLNDPFSLTVLCIVGGGFLLAVIYQIRVRMNGIEAEAVITWIEEKEMFDSDSGVSIYYDVHVVYATRDGEHIEGTLSNVLQHFEEGEHIRIKYIPSHKELPVFVGRIS